MVKNIIFDFGDIFINLDKEATFRELQRLGGNFNPELLELAQAYEKGAMSSKQFLEDLQEHFPAATQEELTRAWNAIILDFPQYRLDFLQELNNSGKYRLFLLSNTNALHIDQVKVNMGDGRYQLFQQQFEGFYLSHEIKMRKPDPEIYQYVLEQNQLVASEIFFIDDTLENTLAAERLGIKSWNLLVGQEDIVQFANKLH